MHILRTGLVMPIVISSLSTVVKTASGTLTSGYEMLILKETLPHPHWFL